MTASTAEVFRTTTVKVTFPPGDCTEVWFAAFSSVSEDPTSVSVTVASSSSLLVALVVLAGGRTTSVFASPALPLMVRVNLQMYVPLDRLRHVMEPLPSRSIEPDPGRRDRRRAR